MKTLSTMAMVAGLAGCEDGVVLSQEDPRQVGSNLSEGITPMDCFNYLDSNRIALGEQSDGVVNMGGEDAVVTSGGQFSDVYQLVREDLANNAVLLAAIANIDGSTSTVRAGQMSTRTDSEDFGNGSIDSESPIVDAKINFGATTSLAGTEIDAVVTNPNCTELNSPVFNYAVEDYGYEDAYYVEEL